jgi:hypothetical protein
MRLNDDGRTVAAMDLLAPGSAASHRSFVHKPLTLMLKSFIVDRET